MCDSHTWPFVARHDEQDRFTALLDAAKLADAQNKPSNVLLVEGLGGIGKSFLLKRFADIARGTASGVLNQQTVFLTVNIDWQTERERRTAAFSGTAGPDILTVLLIMQGAIIDAVRELRLSQRAVQRAFRDFGKVVAQTPQLKAVAERAENELTQTDGAQAQVIGSLAALASTFAAGTPAAPVVLPAAAAAQPLASLAQAAGRRRSTAPSGTELDEAFRVEEALARTFATALMTVSKDRPVVLLLDTYEIILGAGRWLRAVSRQSGERVVWVIAGRLESERAAGESSEAAAFRRELPEGRLRVIPMTRFADDTVTRLLTETVPSEMLKPEAAAAAVAVTKGIPFAVRIVSGLLAQGADAESLLSPLTDRGDGSEVVRELAERYLKHVREDPALVGDAPLLYGLSLLYGDRSDPELIQALWQRDDSTEILLAALTRRHDFVLTATRRLHEDVRDVIRSYLLEPVRRNDVREANTHARDVLMRRLADGPISLESRLEDESWRTNMLTLLWHTFWISDQQGIELLSEILTASRLLRPSFARDAVEVAGFFADSLSQDQLRVLRGLGQLLTFGAFVDGWLAKRRADPKTSRTAGFLGRLVDDSRDGDVRFALGYLQSVASKGSATDSTPTERRALASLLVASRRETPLDERLVNLEIACEVLADFDQISREMARIAKELRTIVRKSDTETLAAAVLVRAGDIDGRCTLATEDALELALYAHFLGTKCGQMGAAERVFTRAIATEPPSADALGTYALYLKRERQDMDRAEKYYKKALAADPADQHNLTNYGIFLQTIRSDPDGAVRLYERAESNKAPFANAFGNHALALLERGENEKAIDLINKAFESAAADDDALRAELWFYLLAVGDKARQREALPNLAALLKAGVRSRGWNLSGLLARVSAERRDSLCLDRLAEVLSGEAEIATVEDWSDWPS